MNLFKNKISKNLSWNFNRNTNEILPKLTKPTLLNINGLCKFERRVNNYLTRFYFSKYHIFHSLTDRIHRAFPVMPLIVKLRKRFFIHNSSSQLSKNKTRTKLRTHAITPNKNIANLLVLFFYLTKDLL